MTLVPIRPPVPLVPGGTARDVLTVGQLARIVKMSLDERFRGVWVVGEITNLKKYPSGHVYFTIKDAEAQFSAVLWRGQAGRLAFDLADGLEVFLNGDVSLYEARGQAQFVVHKIEPKGVGGLQLAFLQMKEKLEKEGLFDPAHKKPLPRFPGTIGIVTSPAGAAIRDMIRTITDRFPPARILVYPVKVQGEGAAAEISQAIRDLNRWEAADVLIVGRGGGSLEDLWAFNEEPVARAIYDSAIPVISAVGHEVDVSIADLVADWRAPTPTAAGEIVVPRYAELVTTLDRSAGVLRGGLLSALTLARSRVERFEKGFGMRIPLELVRTSQRRLDEAAGNLKEAAGRLIEGGRTRVDGFAGKLSALSPLKVLDRGYSVTRSESGKVVRKAGDVSRGMRVRTLLGKGAFWSRVEETE